MIQPWQSPYRWLIGDSRGYKAALALGDEGVQVGDCAHRFNVEIGNMADHPQRVPVCIRPDLCLQGHVFLE